MDDRNLYSMKCFFRDPLAAGGFRDESIVIKAPTDEEALAEAGRTAIFRKPSFFKVSISGPDGEVCLYNSRGEGQ